MANCIRCGRQLPGFSFGKKICQWCVQHEAYQRGEIVEDAKQPVMRTPRVRSGESSIGLTQIIFGINVAVFLAMVFASGDPAAFANPLQEFSTQETLVFGANWGPLTLSGEWWRLLTCVFVHGHLLHIAFNMWCLWNLGNLCESLYGRWTYASIYLISGVGASLASIVWRPGVPSVGASGAIFGLAGALIAAFKLGEFSVPRAALSGTLRSLMVFVVFNLILGAIPGNSTDNAAHIGGLVTGLILGALIAVLAPQHDRDVRRFAIFATVTLVMAGGAAELAHYHGLPLRLGRASTLVEDGKSDRAVGQLEKIVKQRPNFVPARFDLAQEYFNQAAYAKAEIDLKRVLELEPQHAGARALLGMVYLNENRPQEAKDSFAQLLTQDPNNAEGHFGLGLTLAAEDNHQAAIEEYQSAARIDPQSAGVNYNLGLSYAKLNQTDNAIAAYLKERQQSGDDYELEAALASDYQVKGLTQQAQEAKNQASRLKGAGQ
jgi:membrane associated rhomboid family serine protease/Flp pilus assembly protein TadD